MGDDFSELLKNLNKLDEELKRLQLINKEISDMSDGKSDTFRYRRGSYSKGTSSSGGDLISFETFPEPQKAIKHDNEKPEFHHIPNEALTEIARALTFGAKKYADYNWRAGFTWSRPFNACMRHLWAWWGGENNDPESGLSHLAHAGANILFLLQFIIDKRGSDNRYNNKKEGQND